MIKQTITVPDFGSGEFTTSTVIVAQKVDELQTPLPSRPAGGESIHLRADEDHARGGPEVQQEG